MGLPRIHGGVIPVAPPNMHRARRGLRLIVGSQLGGTQHVAFVGRPISQPGLAWGPESSLGAGEERVA
jgi:hypothetical protein